MCNLLQLLLLLFSYHRCLRMISEALEIHPEGGQDSYSWCMCVGSHGYCGLVGGRDGGGGWYSCETKPVGVGPMS